LINQFFIFLFLNINFTVAILAQDTMTEYNTYPNIINEITTFRECINNIVKYHSQYLPMNYNKVLKLKYRKLPENITQYYTQLVLFEDNIIRDHCKKYDKYVGNLGYFLHCIIYNLARYKFKLGGGAIRQIFECDIVSNKIDLDYTINEDYINFHHNFLTYPSKNTYILNIDFIIFIIYNRIYNDNNLELIKIAKFRIPSSPNDSLTFTYKIKNFIVNFDINCNSAHQLCNTIDPLHKYCNIDFEQNGLELNLYKENIEYKYRLNTYRPYKDVPKHNKLLLCKINMHMLVNALLNIKESFLMPHIIEIIIMYLGQDFEYLLKIIYTIILKIMYPTHTLCTNYYSCRRNQNINDKIITCPSCSLIYYRLYKRYQKFENRKWTIVNYKCDKSLCCLSYQLDKNINCINVESVVDIYNSGKYSTPFNIFLKKTCTEYNLNFDNWMKYYNYKINNYYKKILIDYRIESDYGFEDILYLKGKRNKYLFFKSIKLSKNKYNILKKNNNNHNKKNMIHYPHTL